MRAITRKHAEFDYVPHRERGVPEAEQTVFILRPLSLGQFVAVRGVPGATIEERLAARCEAALYHGLVGWRNLLDEDGKGIEFERVEGGPHAQPCLAMLPYSVLAELAEQILVGAQVSEGDSGKSDSEPSSP